MGLGLGLGLRLGLGLGLRLGLGLGLRLGLGSGFSFGFGFGFGFGQVGLGRVRAEWGQWMGGSHQREDATEHDAAEGQDASKSKRRLCHEDSEGL